MADKAVVVSLPDVPPVSHDLQKKAAEETLGGSCPALAELAGIALVTRDQIRALKK